MKFKMTPLERKWVWYDVGNSAFTLLVSTLIPIFFSLMDGGETESATAALGYATSIATAVVAILGPILGSLSDLRGMRKVIFMGSVLVGALGCVALGFMQHWLWFLVLLVIAKSAYQLSLVVYDSMLCDITQRERMDEVSSRGYAWGYIGSCIPFVLSVFVYVLYAMPDLFGAEHILSLEASMIIVFLLTAVWWVACTLPLWKSYRQVNFVDPGSHPVRAGFRSLGKTFRELVTKKHILLFLIAFFFFIDGVYTIIDLAVAYGTDLGLDTVSLVLALLVTQVVAFPAAILLGMLSRKVKPQYLILACIVAYFFITVYAVFLDQEYEFWSSRCASASSRAPSRRCLAPTSPRSSRSTRRASTSASTTSSARARPSWAPSSWRWSPTSPGAKASASPRSRCSSSSGWSCSSSPSAARSPQRGRAESRPRAHLPQPRPQTARRAQKSKIRSHHVAPRG